MLGYSFEPGDRGRRCSTRSRRRRARCRCLQFTAAKLWETRDRQRRRAHPGRATSRWVASRARSRRYADEVIAGFTGNDQKLVRAIFQRLVTPGAHARDRRHGRSARARRGYRSDPRPAGRVAPGRRPLDRGRARARVADQVVARAAPLARREPGGRELPRAGPLGGAAVGREGPGRGPPVAQRGDGRSAAVARAIVARAAAAKKRRSSQPCSRSRLGRSERAAGSSSVRSCSSSR